MVGRLRYADTISLTGVTAGIPVWHLFRANSIYDPDYTSVGHQPYGHDTYASIYNHYQVLRSVCTIQLTNAQTATIGIQLQDDATIVSDTTLFEQKGSTFKAQIAGQPNSIITSYFNTKYYVNKNAQQTAFGSNVSDPMFFAVFAYPSSSGDVLGQCKILVTITYDVLMWELKDLGQS